MSSLLHFGIVLGFWAVKGSQGRVLSEPTQRSHIADHDRPPAATLMVEIPNFRHVAKRHETSFPDDFHTLTVAPDETCGWLSGKSESPITCEFHQTCMWVQSYTMGFILCGVIQETDIKYEVNALCLEREDALDTDICDDSCQSNMLVLRCTGESSAYCQTYAYPEGIQDYRCAPTPVTRVQSVSFTYKGQDHAEFFTTTLTDGDITSTEPTPTTIPETSTIIPPPPPPPPKSEPNIGAIIGGAIGGFMALSLIALAIFWSVRRSKKNDTPPTQQVPPLTQAVSMQQAPQIGIAPVDRSPKKTSATSPVQSEWRDSVITVPNSATDPSSSRPWMNQPRSPSSQSAAYQHDQQPAPPPVAYEMSGDRLEPPTQEMSGESVHS